MDVKPTLPTTDVPVASGDGAGPYEEFTPEERTRGREALWWSLRALYRRRWFVLALTLAAAVGSVVVSLMLPLWYRAESRVLMPQGGGGAYSIINDLAPGAAALLGGGGGGEYTRYLAILTSRTVLGRAVDAFDLEEVYETTGKVDPRGEAITQLGKLASFEVALDYDYLSVAVYDRDPARAAALSNFLVEELNREHMRLTAANARQTRTFVEGRLEEALTALDSARTELAAFQEQHGVLDVETQGTAFFTALAEARAEEARLEIEYGTLQRQYGEDNAQAQALGAALAEARARRQRLEGGGEALLPVPLSRLPEISRRYAALYQEVLTQAEIVEALHPLREQSRFEEERQAVAVQVLDEAVPPARKAKPKRAYIVIAVTLSVLLLACTFVLARAWWGENAAAFARRLGAR